MSFLELFKSKNAGKTSFGGAEFRLLNWCIHSPSCLLVNIETGAEVKITPRGMEVLMHFIGHPETVISANELLDLFWSRSVRSDHAVHNVIAEIRGVLGDSASKPRFIKTYPKRGYALIAPVSKACSARPTNETQRTWSISGASAVFFPKLTAIIATVALASTSLFFAEKQGFWSQNTLAAKQHKVVVKPFGAANVSAEGSYLSNQLPSSLVTRLTKLPNMQVMLSNGSSPEPEGATYSLGGNVQQINGNSRVQVNFTNIESQVILFSDQFDFSSEEVFKIQDQIVQHVVTALSIYLDEEAIDSMQDWGTNSALAYDAFLKAEFYENSSNHASFNAAIDNYLLAVEKDPNFSSAYLGLANVAAKMALYSHAVTVERMRKLVNLSLRELLRIDASSPNVTVAQMLALRVEGNNQKVIEENLRETILQGNPPDFALSHYASLLVGAGMYREAQAYLDLIPDEVPFIVSPDSTWTYRSAVQLPENLIAIKKQQLLSKPEHLGILGSLARSYAYIGDMEHAKLYLGRQIELDAEGPITMLSQIVISGLFGESTPEGDLLEAENSLNPNFNFSLGAKSFIQGDIEQGVWHWRNLDALETRRLFSWLSYVRIFFPESVLTDTRYNALLDELGIGLDWQKHLTEGVNQMAQVTGVPSSKVSDIAYISNRRLVRNNLWNHEEVCYLCTSNFSSMPISME